MAKKTATQEAIESAAWFYRACCDLDQGAGSTHDFARLARDAYHQLEGKLKREVKAWNENLDLEATPPDEAIYLCNGAFELPDDCEIYTTHVQDAGQKNQTSWCASCDRKITEAAARKLPPALTRTHRRKAELSVEGAA